MRNDLKLKSTITDKDFKSQSVKGKEVEFFMTNGDFVTVNLDEQTVFIEDELVDDVDYDYFIQAANEVINDQNQNRLEGIDQDRTEKWLSKNYN